MTDEIRALSVSEIRESERLRLEKCLAEGWGPWKYDPKDHTLEHQRTGYWIALSDVTTSAHMLDWIFQLHGKTWGREDQTVLHLLDAFNDLFHPQATLCSWGKEKGPIKATETIDGLIRFGLGRTL